ncbi:MAG: flagellar assembly protein FliX [Hyphomicrobiales bacterium]
MRIENTSLAAQVRGNKKAGKSSGSSATFSLSDDAAETAEVNTSAPVSNVAHLDVLLALQGVEDSTSGKKRTAEQGFDLLDRLEEMQLGLLTGRLSATQVTRISQKISNLGRTGDEKLDSILSDIDMRARVELAKLGVFDF